MTTAHRPTFDPARGREAQRGPAYHQRLLPAHQTLKYRQATQGNQSETSSRDLRAELLRAERRAHAKKAGLPFAADDDDDDDDDVEHLDDMVNDSRASNGKRALESPSKTTKAIASTATGDGQVEDGEEDYETKRRRVLESTRDIDADSEVDDDDDEETRTAKTSGSNDAVTSERDNGPDRVSSDADSDGDDSDDDDDDSEDETAELMRELEKIKRERAEAAAKVAAEKQAREDELREQEIARGNPLLNGPSSGSGSAGSASTSGQADYGVKRRWDDDVVFKNQARGTSEREKGRSKEFVNDLLRSDFHKRFMSRYVR